MSWEYLGKRRGRHLGAGAYEYDYVWANAEDKKWAEMNETAFPSDYAPSDEPAEGAVIEDFDGDVKALAHKFLIIKI